MTDIVLIILFSWTTLFAKYLLCVCGSLNKWLLNMVRYVLQSLWHVSCHDIDEVQTKFVLCSLHELSYHYRAEIVF
jgi:hypothetical protein